MLPNQETNAERERPCMEQAIHFQRLVHTGYPGNKKPDTLLVLPLIHIQSRKQIQTRPLSYQSSLGRPVRKALRVMLDMHIVLYKIQMEYKHNVSKCLHSSTNVDLSRTYRKSTVNFCWAEKKFPSKKRKRPVKKFFSSPSAFLPPAPHACMLLVEGGPPLLLPHFWWWWWWGGGGWRGKWQEAEEMRVCLMREKEEDGRGETRKKGGGGDQGG